jgi:hypothetical protein
MTTLLIPNREKAGPLILPNQPQPLIKPGAVFLKPTPAKLFASPGYLDREENHIDNEAFIKRLVEGAQEQAVMDRHEWRHNPRTGGRLTPEQVAAIAGGAAGSWTMTNELRAILQGASGAIVPATDTVKIALLLSTSNIGASSTTYAAVTNEVATANGYTQAGITTTLTVSTVSTSNGQLAFTQVQWTASGGSITARFGLAYKSAGHIYGYFLCDSAPADVTATNGNTFTISAGNIWTIS